MGVLALLIVVYYLSRKRHHLLLFCLIGAVADGYSGVYTALIIWALTGTIQIIFDDLVPTMGIIGKREES